MPDRAPAAALDPAVALSTALGSSDPLAIADRQCVQAGDAGLAGNNERRIRLLEAALAIRRHVLGARSFAAADTLDELSRALCADGRFDQARPHAAESLAVRTALLGAGHADIGKSLDRLGEIEFGTGRLAEARALYARALRIRRRRLAPDDPLVANSLNNLACVHARRGDTARATSLFDAVLRIKARALGDTSPELLVLLENLALMHRGAGRFERACACTQRALAIAETAFGGAHPAVAGILSALADGLVGLGRYHDAYAAAERALAIHRDALGPDHPATAVATVSLATVVATIGDLTRAQGMFAHAVAVFRGVAPGRMRDPVLALALYHLALTRGELGELDAARALLEEALALYRAHALERECAMVLHNLAVVERGLKRHAAALAALDEALRLQRRTLGELNRDVAMSLIETARDHDALGATRAAIDAALEGLLVLSCCDDPPSLGWSYETLAAILGRRCRPAGIFFGKLAVNLMQGLRARVTVLGGGLERAFVERREARYRALGDDLIASGRLPEAQQVLAMLKEAELFEITRSGADPRTTRASLTPLELAWQRRLERLRTRLAGSLGAEVGRAAALRRRLARAVTELARATDRLVADFTATEQRRRGTGAARSAWQAPRRDAALLQYLVTVDHLRIVATVAGDQREFRLAVTTGDLNRLVFAMRGGIAERSDRFRDGARRLHDLLIAPLAPLLREAGVRTLMLSLDGALRYVPIAALHDGSRYLIEDFALVLATGAARRDRPAAPAALRGTGLGVSRALVGHSALHGVREELAAVIRTRGGDGVVPGVIRLDRDFSADALRAAAAAPGGLIHIASHFVFAAAQEAESYLLLGDGGKLTLADFAAIEFAGTDLVTLSACDTATGAGHRQSGREIEGLGALARRRGARNVLATLWPVADLTTTALMRAFYRSMCVDGVGAAQSLRAAQLMLLNGEAAGDAASTTRGLIGPDHRDDAPTPGTPHPYYWAPYILIGGPATLRAGLLSRRAGPSNRRRRS